MKTTQLHKRRRAGIHYVARLPALSTPAMRTTATSRQKSSKIVPVKISITSQDGEGKIAILKRAVACHRIEDQDLETCLSQLARIDAEHWS